jgi:hypothetical protein
LGKPASNPAVAQVLLQLLLRQMLLLLLVLHQLGLVLLLLELQVLQHLPFAAWALALAPAAGSSRRASSSS